MKPCHASYAPNKHVQLSNLHLKISDGRLKSFPVIFTRGLTKIPLWFNMGSIMSNISVIGLCDWPAAYKLV